MLVGTEVGKRNKTSFPPPFQLKIIDPLSHVCFCYPSLKEFAFSSLVPVGGFCNDREGLQITVHNSRMFRIRKLEDVQALIWDTCHGLRSWKNPLIFSLYSRAYAETLPLVRPPYERGHMKHLSIGTSLGSAVWSSLDVGHYVNLKWCFSAIINLKGGSECWSSLILTGDTITLYRYGFESREASVS